MQFAIACNFDTSTDRGGAPPEEDDPSAADASSVVGADAGEVSEDAAPGAADSAPAPTYQIIETLSVAANGFHSLSESTLAIGETYRLRVSGTFTISTNNNWEADAEYFNFSNLPSSLSDTVVGVDNGLAIDDFIVNSDRSPRWGAYQPSHIYEVDFVGKGAPISANLHDGNYLNNSGSLQLDILRLQ